MDIDTYAYLLELVTPHIIKENTCMRPEISPHERPTATLRFLATGRSYKDLEFTTIISKQSLSEIIPETCEAIFKVLKNEYLKFPKTEEEWLKVAAEFERMWQFPHCLGAIDGKHIRIVPPKGSGSYYFNYKKNPQCCSYGNSHCQLRIFYCDIGTNGLKMDNVDTVVLACCALHNFLRRKSPKNYTPPESLDQENILECTVELGERCDPQLVHDLQRGARGHILNSAIEIRNHSKDYFNNEGSVLWQDKFITLNN